VVTEAVGGGAWTGVVVAKRLASVTGGKLLHAV
jgi:hypothetical protein